MEPRGGVVNPQTSSVPNLFTSRFCDKVVTARSRERRVVLPLFLFMVLKKADPRTVASVGGKDIVRLVAYITGACVKHDLAMLATRKSLFNQIILAKCFFSRFFFDVRFYLFKLFFKR